MSIVVTPFDLVKAWLVILCASASLAIELLWTLLGQA